MDEYNRGRDFVSGCVIAFLKSKMGTTTYENLMQRNTQSTLLAPTKTPPVFEHQGPFKTTPAFKIKSATNNGPVLKFKSSSNQTPVSEPKPPTRQLPTPNTHSAGRIKRNTAITYITNEQKDYIERLKLICDANTCGLLETHPQRLRMISTSAPLGISYSYSNMRTLYILLEKPADTENLEKIHFTVNFRGKKVMPSRIFEQEETFTFDLLKHTTNHTFSHFEAGGKTPQIIKNEGYIRSQIHEHGKLILITIRIKVMNYHLFNNTDPNDENEYTFRVQYSNTGSDERHEVVNSHNTFMMYSKPHGRKADVGCEREQLFKQALECYQQIIPSLKKMARK